MTQPMVQMSAEQLQQLIDSLRNVAMTPVRVKHGMSDCPTAYGGERDPYELENFIAYLLTYKELESISDEEAFKGISLVFYNEATKWWKGVRKEAKTFDDVLRLLREDFSPAKPCYQIYMEIFEKKQDDKTAIDPFVCDKRALLSELPDRRLDEETELDMIYSLLNIKYRQHIERLEVKTIRELLEKGRIIEKNKMELEAKQEATLRGAKRKRRCTFCNARGHTYDKCRKRMTENEKAINGTSPSKDDGAFSERNSSYVVNTCSGNNSKKDE